MNKPDFVLFQGHGPAISRAGAKFSFESFQYLAKKAFESFSSRTMNSHFKVEASSFHSTKMTEFDPYEVLEPQPHVIKLKSSESSEVSENHKLDL